MFHPVHPVILSKRTVLLGLVIFTCLHPAHANPAHLFRDGNKAYAAGRFNEAAKAYQKAASEAPESAEILYNLGNAQYRAGSLTEAQVSFEYAASIAGSDSLRSQCWYNMANCMVKTAEAFRESEPQAAVQYCQQAAWLYRTALEYNNDFSDAAYNLEMSQRISAAIVKEIREQEEKEQQENELIKYLREKLEEFIERQTKLIETKVASEPQRILEKDTRELAKVMEDSGLHADFDLPDGTKMPGPLKETYDHTLKAADAMAVPDQSTALAELIAALGAAPEDPDQQDGESADDSEDYADSDMD